MKFERYKQYDISTLEYLNKIPNEWDTCRVKDIFKLITDVAPVNNDMQLLSIFASIGVKPRSEMEQKGNKSITTDNYWIVRKGDFIVNKLLAWMGAIAISDYDGVTSPAYDILRKKTNINQKYYEYLFRTELMQSVFKKYSKGIMDVRLRLYFDKFGQIEVPLLSHNNFDTIVNYLDVKISRIDKEISILEQKIEKFKELKQVLISETVLRGLDKKVELKDSEIEWIRDIPKHWEVKRYKDSFELLSSGIKSFDGLKSYLSTKSVGVNKIIEIEDNITFLDRPSRANMQPIKNTAWFAKMRFTDKCLIFKDNEYESYILSTGFAGIKIKYDYIDFIKYYLMSTYFKFEKDMYSYGTTQESINDTNIAVISFVKPPYGEQVEIANYLDEKTSKIVSIVEAIGKKIEVLKEFRKTLINDVVTGKVKVA